MTENINEVTVGSVAMDLAALAGVDMAGVQEVRSRTLAAGRFLFKVTDAKLEAREVTRDGEQVNKPVVDFQLEVSDCLLCVNEDLDPATFIGRKHKNTFWISCIHEDLGRVRAFLTDIGVVGESGMRLDAMVNEAHGVEFISDITNTKNKDNPDIVYANLKNTMTIAKYQEATASASE